MSAARNTLFLYGGAALAVGVVGYLLLKQGAGLVSGNNAITRNATNASGEPVTAYQGAGIVGTIGAATNAASGGILASVGQWLGGKAADLRDYISGDDVTASTGLQGSKPAIVGPKGEDYLDRWDYYARGGQSAGSGSGGATGGW